MLTQSKGPLHRSSTHQSVHDACAGTMDPASWALGQDVEAHAHHEAGPGRIGGTLTTLTLLSSCAMRVPAPHRPANRDDAIQRTSRHLSLSRAHAATCLLP
jgi:hypothetical protein